MSYKFLSDEWFTEVDKIRAEAGALDIPAQLQGLTINIKVNDAPAGKNLMMLKNGNLEAGNEASAPTTLSLSAEIARKIFIDNDRSAGMQAFMSGQLKVEGDMMQMMSLQTVQPTASQSALQAKIKAITA